MAIVTTTKGDLDDSLLVRKDTSDKVPDGQIEATEYYLNDELVHRSVHFIANDPSQPTS